MPPERRVCLASQWRLRDGRVSVRPIPATSRRDSAVERQESPTRAP
ncbi:hypothetical protein [Lichenibacterium ramalinae]|nr:hypothetical protein [Lichenibacterium ramalinae]